MKIEQFMNRIPESSGFADDETFFKGIPCSECLVSEEGGFPLFADNGRYYFDGPLEIRHNLIIGATSSGKTRRYILPGLKSFIEARKRRSIIVFDVKGELYEKTHARARKLKWPVKLLNLRDPASSTVRWNLFGLANDLFFSAHDEEQAWTALDSVATLIFNDSNSVRKSGGSTDPFWANSSRAVFRGISDLLWNKYHKPITPKAISEKLATIDPDSDRCDLYTDALSLGENSMAYRGLSSLISASPLTRGNIISSFLSYFSCLSGRKDIENFLSCTKSFDFASVGDEPMLLYIIVPDDNKSLLALQNIILSNMIQRLNESAMSHGGTLPVRVEIVIDEFANIPPIPMLGSQLTISRGRGIRYTVALQSFTQLFDVYGASANSICENCGTWICLYSPKDSSLMERLSQLCGRNFFDDPLIRPSELSGLPIGHTLILRERQRPYLSLLCDIDEYVQAMPVSTLNQRRRAS